MAINTSDMNITLPPADTVMNAIFSIKGVVVLCAVIVVGLVIAIIIMKRKQSKEEVPDTLPQLSQPEEQSLDGLKTSIQEPFPIPAPKPVEVEVQPELDENFTKREDFIRTAIKTLSDRKLGLFSKASESEESKKTFLIGAAEEDNRIIEYLENALVEKPKKMTLPKVGL